MEYCGAGVGSPRLNGARAAKSRRRRDDQAERVINPVQAGVLIAVGSRNGITLPFRLLRGLQRVAEIGRRTLLTSRCSLGPRCNGFHEPLTRVSLYRVRT